MYLISVEGGDGSGKGEAVRLLNEILAKYPFAEVCSTHEPRRHADTGRRALEAVQRGDMTPAEEAALFAEDRLDHTKSWILPRLQRSAVVISDRNIHSSLVYQGVVGDLGLDEVAALNEGAAVPDLVVWIDCDPERAIRRIQSGTLRMTSAKQEYFETSDIQKKIRAGFASLLSGEVKAPAPFDRCTIAGPVLNEGGLDELEKALRKTVRDFMRTRPEPQNVNAETVDQHVIANLVEGMSAQQRLPGMPVSSEPVLHGWLNGASPATWMERAEASWPERSALEHDVPRRFTAMSVWSVVGTLSLMDGTSDVRRLYHALGPVRFVSLRHVRRLVKWLIGEGWIFRQQNEVKFAEGQMFRLSDDHLAQGRLALALWPLREHLETWREKHPKASWATAMASVVQDAPEQVVNDVLARLSLLSSGHVGCPAPEDATQLEGWWRLDPPA